MRDVDKRRNKKRYKNEEKRKNRRFKLKYPKFFLLVLTYMLASLLFIERDFTPLNNFLNSLGYFGIFLAGVFYTYGFTSGPATALLLIFAEKYSILLSGLLAGFGALVGDLIIFKFIRIGFSDELKKVSQEPFAKKIKRKVPYKLRMVFFPILGGIIMASPLPDEIGISMFAVSTRISERFFALLSYLLNTSGILIILAIGAL